MITCRPHTPEGPDELTPEQGPTDMAFAVTCHPHVCLDLRDKGGQIADQP